MNGSIGCITQVCTNSHIFVMLGFLFLYSLYFCNFFQSGGRMFDSWEWWNTFRLLCEHHSQLCVALDILYVRNCSMFQNSGLVLIFILIIFIKFLWLQYWDWIRNSLIVFQELFAIYKLNWSLVWRTCSSSHHSYQCKYFLRFAFL